MLCIDPFIANPKAWIWTVLFKAPSSVGSRFIALGWEKTSTWPFSRTRVIKRQPYLLGSVLSFSLVYKGPKLENSNQFYSLPIIMTRPGVRGGGEDAKSDYSQKQSERLESEGNTRPVGSGPLWKVTWGAKANLAQPSSQMAGPSQIMGAVDQAGAACVEGGPILQGKDLQSPGEAKCAGTL